MSVEKNKAVIYRYFEALDQREVGIVEEAWHPECVIHRTDQSAPVRGHNGIRRVLTTNWDLFSELSTTIEDLFAEGDRVGVRVLHHATHRTDWESPIGRLPAAGRRVTWQALAIFRLADGKIVEQWVMRDELRLLRQLGALPGPA